MSCCWKRCDGFIIRRRGETVNFLRGNETAVMLGDYLISNAFHLCSRAGDPALNLRLGEVTLAGGRFTLKATVPKGASAFGVRLLDRLVQDNYEG